MTRGSRILFINYSDSWHPTAHNFCFLDTVRVVMATVAGRNAQIIASVISLNAERRADELPDMAAEYVPVPRPAGSAFIRLILNSRFVLRYIERWKPDIVYTYGETALFSLLLHRFSPVIRYCFDSRGDYLAEEKERGRGWLRLRMLRQLLERMVKKTVLVITASGPLEEQFRHLHPRASYCRVSNYYREELYPAVPGSGREQTLIYAGGTQDYQAFDAVFSFFHGYHARNRESCLIIAVSCGEARIREHAEKAGIPAGTVTVVSCQDRRQLYLYLTRAGAGLMLRRKSPVNEAAFPTKFAEYLACGLPVISTPCVPDTAEIIKENRLGVLLDPENPAAPEGIEKVRNLLAEPDIHERCAAYARQHLSWDVHRERVAKAILGEE